MPPKRPSDASDMTLDELVRTQGSGYTPGETYRQKQERLWPPDKLVELIDEGGKRPKSWPQ